MPVALMPPRRPNNRPADIHSREVDRDGGPGLYPGGKSPRRNQHDRGERPTRAYTYNATGIIPDYLQRSAISISVRRRLLLHCGRARRSCIPIPAIVSISSRGVGRNCFLLSKAHLVLFRCDFFDLFDVSNKGFFSYIKEKFAFENAITEHDFSERK